MYFHLHFLKKNQTSSSKFKQISRYAAWVLSSPSLPPSLCGVLENAPQSLSEQKSFGCLVWVKVWIAAWFQFLWNHSFLSSEPQAILIQSMSEKESRDSKEPEAKEDVYL